MQESISQLLDNSYREWALGDYIFIHAATGTGKTYFILYVLYEYAIEHDYSIVLLVNRRILKQQIISDLQKYDAKRGRQQCQMQIFTYQELEMSGRNSWKHRCVQEARYVVCDEAHYFLTDSMFNPGTSKSFELIMGMIPTKITIFMTATPNKIKPVIAGRAENDYQERKMVWEEDETRRKQRNEQVKYESCRYREDGSECDLSEFGERLEAYEGSIQEMQEALEPSPEPVNSRLIEYSLSRTLTDNLIPHFFNEVEDLKEVIKGGSFNGKWLIFVSSKRIGKDLHTELANHFGGKKHIVFIDADYGLKGHEKALEEVSEIVQKSKLAADILICTSVLDNGVSICDSKLCNLVIMADDEIEFLQMLGRKRLIQEDEEFHLFLTGGSVSYFQKREKGYLEWYWRLCNNLQFSVAEVYDLLDTMSLTMKDIGSCYNHEGDMFYVNPLAIEEIRLKYTFCSQMAAELCNDDNAFLKKQMQWLNLEYTDDFYLTQNIQYSQEDVALITSCLENIHKLEGGLVSKDQFNELKKAILTVASTTDASYGKKSGTVETVNIILQSLPDWKQYQFSSIHLEKTTYYELVFENKNCINIDKEKITLDCFKQIIASCQNDITQECFESITGCPIPACLADDNAKIKALINVKMKSVEHLSGYMIKNQSGGALRIMPRPKNSELSS